MISSLRFVFLEEWYNYIREVPEKRMYQLFSAISHYAFFGVLDQIDSKEDKKYFETLIRPNLDRQKSKWDEQMKKEYELGRMRYLSRKGGSNAKK